MGADEPLDRDRGAETDNVGTRRPDAGRKLRGQEAGAGIEAVEAARQHQGFDVAIGQETN